MGDDTRIAARLARLSFADAPQAAQLLAGPPLRWWDTATNRPTSAAAAVVVAALSRTADPDTALRALAAAAAAASGPALRDAVESDPQVRARLLPLLGVSVELGDFLVSNPDAWQVLRGDLDVSGVPARLAAAVGAVADDPVTGTSGTRAKLSGSDAASALRIAYRTELLAIAGRDLAGDLPLREVTEHLADLAGHALQTALTVAADELPDTAAPCRLAIIAMGKTGSRELNYVSDVDVVFVAEPPADHTGDPGDSAPALSTAAKLAGATMRLCRAVAWEVDANLRPEGKAGPLVRTLASHEAYYKRWASTWEFQALLKARPVAGDHELGAAYAEVIAPLVWTAAERRNFVADVRAMRQRVVDHIPVAIGPRDIKLARGGLRDVEFAVQLLRSCTAAATRRYGFRRRCRRWMRCAAGDM